MFSRESLAIMEAAVDAVVVIDHRGRIQAVNAAACRAFGYATHDLLGQNVSMLMPEPDRSRHDDYMARYQESGEPHIIGIGRDVIAQRRDGSQFPARLSVGRVPDAAPARFVGLVRDITAERAANAEIKMQREEALRVKERLTQVAQLATAGEMAAALAHEINQPLTAITTFANACARYLDSPRPDLDEIRAALREISAEGLRAGDIIRRLRRMVRLDAPDTRTRVDMNALIEELRSLLESDARAHDVRLRLDLSQRVPAVIGNGLHLQQVVLNLARNGFEALMDTSPGNRQLTVRTVPAGEDGVEIQVEDNGPGIDPAIADRLFEPFSTTKRAGTGLGLAMSRTIVQSHGGTITSNPESPQGTRFVIRLPAAEEVVA
jgi:two-component system, LuxR family, sensor kinase FixL